MFLAARLFARTIIRTWMNQARKLVRKAVKDIREAFARRRRRGKPDATVQVEGLPEAKRQIGRAAKVIHQAAREALMESALAIHEEARSRVPVDSGSLRRGIKVYPSKRGDVIEIGVKDPDLDYAQFVEFGTSSEPAQPFLTPALEAERRKLERRIAKHVERAIARKLKPRGGKFR